MFEPRELSTKEPSSETLAERIKCKDEERAFTTEPEELNPLQAPSLLKTPYFASAKSLMSSIKGEDGEETKAHFHVCASVVEWGGSEPIAFNADWTIYCPKTK